MKHRLDGKVMRMLRKAIVFCSINIRDPAIRAEVAT